MEKEVTVGFVIKNIDEFYELIKKAQQQSTELKNTLSKVEEFIPDIELSKKKQVWSGLLEVKICP